MKMSQIRNNLQQLVDNYLNLSGKSIEAIYVFDRDGLIITRGISLDKRSDDNSEIYGAIAGSVEPTLKRITSEFPGSFGTGTVETEDHRLIFTEAGPKAILLSVFKFDAILNFIMPYVFLIAEKISQIIDERFDDISVDIPDLHIGEEMGIKSSKISNLDISNQNIAFKQMEIIFKLCVIGEPSVGKTSTINQFVTNKFNSEYKPTLGISITTQKYNMQGFEDRQINFMIWDLAGQKFFQRVRKYYYTAANAAFIIYDITRRETFDERVKFWYDDIREVIPEIPIVIIGNKLDLEENRQVSKEEGLSIAKELKCTFMETSAKSGVNVRDIFSLVGIGLFFNHSEKTE